MSAGAPGTRHSVPAVAAGSEATVKQRLSSASAPCEATTSLKAVLGGAALVELDLREGETDDMRYMSARRVHTTRHAAVHDESSRQGSRPRKHEPVLLHSAKESGLVLFQVRQQPSTQLSGRQQLHRGFKQLCRRCLRDTGADTLCQTGHKPLLAASRSHDFLWSVRVMCQHNTKADKHDAKGTAMPCTSLRNAKKVRDRTGDSRLGNRWLASDTICDANFVTSLRTNMWLPP